MKKHLTVKETRHLLGGDRVTMGEDVHCVVVVGEAEYPVVGVESYDGVFCRFVLGAEMTEENQGKIRRDGDDVLVVA